MLSSMNTIVGASLDCGVMMGGDAYCHGLGTVCGGGGDVRLGGSRCWLSVGSFPGMCASAALWWVAFLGVVVGVFTCWGTSR